MIGITRIIDRELLLGISVELAEIPIIVILGLELWK
jgi:hypothetical protein